MWEIWGALACGARLVVVPYWTSLSPEAFCGLLARERVTVLNQTPSAFYQLSWAEESGATAADGELALRTVIFGGEALEPAALAPWLARHGDQRPRLVNMYGITETTVHVTYRPLAAGDARPGEGSVLGEPIPDLRLYVLDPWGEPATPGVPGEICVGGAGLARGYLHRPDLTAERFTPDPFIAELGETGARLYRSGDLARRRRDGDLEYLGRIDHQIKIRGFRIEPAEIEAALAADPEVREAVVLALGEAADRRLIAYATPRTGLAAGLDGVALRERLAARLPSHMVPAAVVPLAALPLTANGKIDRSALARLAADDLEGGAAGEGWSAPRTPVEEIVAGLYAAVLQRERVGAGDDFFALGGHSLLATQVVSRLRRAFGVEVPLPTLFEAPTVTALAAAVEELLAAGRGDQAPPLVPVPRAGDLPLSFAQERLWFLHRLAPGSSAYNVPLAVGLHGVLAPPVLAAALTALVARHEALRTTFAEGGDAGGLPVQRIAPPAAVPLPLLDLTALPAAARRREAARLAAAGAGRPFNLARGPLLRAVLLRLEEERHTALLTLHHIVTDGWSMSILVREMGALYRAAAASAAPALPELPVQYADFAVWQRRWLAGDVLAAHLAWWREHLAGAPAVLDLPGDRPRPVAPSFRGGEVGAFLPADLAAGITALGRGGEATPFMVLLAAFQTLLARLSGQSDVVVGTPVANRNRLETEGLIGVFINSLALRAELSDDPAFGALLARVRATALGAYAHQDLPFEKLVDALQPQRSLAHAPLFQVMLVFQNAPAAGVRTAGLTLSPEPIETGEGAAKLDLTLALSETTAGGVAAAWQFATDLFDAATVARMAAQLQTLLAAAVARPETPVFDLPLLTAAERHQLLTGWNDTARFARPAWTVHARCAARAARWPEAPAVVGDGEVLTAGELDRYAGRIANFLRRLAVRPGDLVGICAPRSPRLIAAVLGILKAGAAYLPLDPGYPAERLAFLLADANIAVLLTEESLAASLPPNSARAVLLDAGPDRAAIAAENAEDPRFAVDPDALAYVLYTSGSTGRPKGVMVSHAGLTHYLSWALEVYAGSDGVAGGTFLHTSTSFDLTVTSLFLPLLAGEPVTVVSEAEGVDALAAALRRRSTPLRFLKLTPSHARLLGQQLAASELAGRTRALILGGEGLAGTDLAPWREADPEVMIHNEYGPTEAVVGCTLYSAPVRALGPGPVPIGRPIAGAQIYLLDARLAPVPVGVAGELWIGGDGLARGYLRRPDLTAERFLPDPYAGDPGARLYRTGDVARRRPDGVLDYVGRLDHQVKVRGFRVELGEIEAALLAHPDVREAVVLVRDDGPGGLRLIACISCGEPRGGRPEPAELRDWLARRLPPYMVPAGFALLDALPLSPNGKVDRRALALLTPEVARRASAPAAVPESPIAELVAGIWAEVLGLERAEAGDDFFALGGHSLLATQVMSRLRMALGVEVPLRTLFESPTLAAFAAAVEERRAEEQGVAAPPLVPVPRDRVLPLSFAQQRLWFLHQLAPASAAYNTPFALHLSGCLDAPALAWALEQVVRRHETLRTTFAVSGGEPVQSIAPPAPLPLPVADLAALPEASRHAEARRLTAEEALLPFDLSRPPVVRACLLRLGVAEHALLFTIHHISGDGWSTGVLTNEVAELYDACTHGRAPVLPALPVQYADYAVWQREWLQGQVLAEQIDWWRSQLAGAPAFLELPADHPRPPVQSDRSGRIELALPTETARAVAACGRHEGATLFMTLLTAFAVLLQRYSGQRTVVVGTPIANRHRLEVEGLIGYFSNTLALRADFGDDPAFRVLLRRVRETALGAYARQDLPFEKLVDELQPPRDMSHAPLFQVMLVVQNATAGTGLRLGDLELRAFGAPPSAARFDLTLTATAGTGDLMLCGLDYNADLFERDTAARLLRLFAGLLATATARPDRPLSELPLLDDEERREVLLRWNEPGRDPSLDSLDPDPAAETCLHHLFAAWAARTPDAPALLFEGETVTYGELAGRAARIAHRLWELGVGPEVPVAVCGERSPDTLAALLGVLTAGGVYVPLDPEAPRERLAAITADAGAAVLLTQERFASALAGLAPAVLHLDASMGEESAAESAGPAAPAAEALLPSAESAAYVIYTSGSTGVSKGVVATHRNFVSFVRGLAAATAMGPQDRLLLFAPLSFDASLLQIFLPLTSGGALVVHRNPRQLAAHEILALAGQSGLTVLDLPAALWRQWVQEVAEQRLPLPAGLRLFLTGGESVSAAQLATWAGLTERRVAFLSSYGPTETTVTATVFRTTNDRAGTLGRPNVPLGRPLPGVRCHVLDRWMQPVPRGVSGDLYLAGAGLTRGYLGRPDLTADAFRPDPLPALGCGEPGGRLYYTGDLARWIPGLADGELEFLGRADHQVKVRGFRIESGEIEAALAAHPAVRQAVVAVREDVPGDRRLAAYLVTEEPPPTPAELRLLLAERLPDYMIPSSFTCLERMPVLPTGKVDRAALPVPDRSAASGRIQTPPRNALEEVLAALWAELLGIAQVGIEDDFFGLGGHSLLAARLIGRLREALGTEIELRLLFEAPTISRLAEALLRDPERREGIERMAEVTLAVARLSAEEIDAMFDDDDLALPVP